MIRRPGSRPTSGGRNASFQTSEQQREAEAAAVPGLRARLAAQLVIADVIVGGHTLDDRFVPGAIPWRLAGLDGRDTSLVRSIATVAVRRLGTIRHLLADLLEKGMPRNSGTLEWVLIAGAAQVIFLDLPDHAVVDLAVRATRLDAKAAPYAGLVNAVLRNLARTREAAQASGPAITLDTPAWLANRWRKNWGEDTATAIAAMNQCEPTLDITVRDDAEGWAQRLGGIALPNGSVRVESHAPVVDLEGYADGAWWVQDAAASLPARLLNVQAGERVLDLCAAPGGKTAQLAATGAQVTALDRSAERLKLLTANLARLNMAADLVVADAVSWSAEPFDAVLVDPPCSATGTIRRHPDVAWTKRPGDLETLVVLQSKMLDRAASLVKPGGRLVYCTCSIEPEEGEQQIAALLRRNPDMRRDPVAAGESGIPAECLTADGELRTLPSHWPNANPRMAGMDGFFAARLRRQG